MSISRQNDRLYIDDVPAIEIAKEFGTPIYVYSWQEIFSRFSSLSKCFESVPHQIHYAVKANDNLAILSRLAKLGCGFDIVSGGELERVLTAGGDANKVVFSGVGKSTSELSFALKAKVGSINVESSSEFERLSKLSRQLNVVANVSLRVNPDIPVDTHPYITTGMRQNKFGIPPKVALNLAQIAHQNSHMVFRGFACHLGSQIEDISPYLTAIRELRRYSAGLQESGIDSPTINIGGGFSIQYDTEQRFPFDALSRESAKLLNGSGMVLSMEPGRVLIAEAGMLLTTVEYLKPAEEPGYMNYAIVDAAMNDLIRPSLYGAYHAVEPVMPSNCPEQLWNIAGPICETGDFIAKDRKLALKEGMVLAVMCTGAYGFSQSSNYNSRPRVPEILVDQNAIHVIRQRESMIDLMRHERIH